MTIRNISYAGEGLIPPPLRGPAKRYTPLPSRNVTDIAVHHMTGTGPPTTATATQEIFFLRRIDKYHRAPEPEGRGLDGIGYHIVAMASGRIWIVSPLDRYGAHVGYQNNHLLGLALPGDYTIDLPAPGHLTAAIEAVRHLYSYLGRPVLTRPHLYWDGSTACPGRRWREWVPQLRTQALAEEGSNLPDPIFRTPGRPDAQVGVPGKHVIGHGEHVPALVKGGAVIVQVSQGLWDAIPNVTDVTRAPTGQSDADLARIAKAVADEQARRMQQ